MKAVILAAGVGRRLKDCFDKPKCLLEIKGESLISRYLRELFQIGISRVTLVIGYKKDEIIKEIQRLRTSSDVSFVFNPDYNEGSILSLYAARNEINDDIILMDGDVYFETAVLARMTGSDHANCLLVDRISENDGEAMMAGASNGRAAILERGLKANYDSVGEWIGFIKLEQAAARALIDLADKKISASIRSIGYEDCFTDLFKIQPVYCEYVDGLKWTEIDFKDDLIRAARL